MKNRKKNWIIVAAAIVLIAIIILVVDFSKKESTLPPEELSREEFLRQWLADSDNEPPAEINPDVIRNLTAP